ncbi:uncharacterized protein LOC124155916 isoform X2 [Ischnura elegans]|uniref:uncharacterized protein LOC124155916 isoform X2 n=1 Tax=Ischnura elegans TaxID=197161 RepID=UPI001ED8B876|nr:uncharacterized protein LOC124155916 isoform X2 [Ischnura elegans]
MESDRGRPGLAWRLALLQILLFVPSRASQCPWSLSSPQLQASCLCASNSAKEVSVQCDAADYQLLLDGLAASTRSPTGTTVPIDLLYVNNSSLEHLGPELIKSAGVVPRSLQVSGCQIRSVAADAFQPLIGSGSSAYRGEPSNMRNLNLHSNYLENIPVEALRPLTSLTLLDLSHNRISNIPIGAFSSLRSLTTLRLGGNPFALRVPSAGAFRGLSTSLRNLDLKATRQRVFPAAAIRGLRALAFLDLSQNSIREIGGENKSDSRNDGPMSTLDSIAAINLERNLIRKVHPRDFQGINDTLSSLSLLNNLLADFPIAAVSTLSELRVLDLGFNLIANIPLEAFKGTPSLTLLALDGNPLPTLTSDVLLPVASSLRGLSIGGRSLTCNCKLRWLANWIQKGIVPGGGDRSSGSTDIQVTSRERDPQFCGAPARLREKPFHLIQAEELTCEDEKEEEEEVKPEVKKDEQQEQDDDPENKRPWGPTTATTSSSTNRPPITTYKSPVGLGPFPTQRPTTSSTTRLPSSTTTATTTSTSTTTTATTSTATTPKRTFPTTTQTTTTEFITTGLTGSPSFTVSKQPQLIKHSTSTPTIRNKSTAPPIVRLGDADKKKIQTKDKQTKIGDTEGSNEKKNIDVIVQSIARQENSVIIKWEPANKGQGASRPSGYRVIYRLFGDSTFRRGPPLEPSEREFRIKNVPSQECIVVCVTSLDRPTLTPESVPFSQCKEVRTSQNGHGASHGAPPPNSSGGGSQHMDKITIAASAAICGTVVLAVIVFVATSRKKHKSQRSDSDINEKKAALAAAGLGPGIGMIGPHQLMHPHLVPVHPLHPVAYSQKGTLNRSTLYLHNGGGGMPTSQAPTIMVDQMAGPMPNGMGTGVASDWEQGSVYSGRSIPRPQVFPEQMTSGGLRMSQHSLTNISLASERMSGRASGTGYPQSYDVGANTCQHQHRARKNQGGNGRGASSAARSRRRYGGGGSGGGYDTTSDNNWTDHDLDIYVARNPTRASGRGGGDRLVQL